MKSKLDTEVDKLECQIQELQTKVAELRRRRRPEQVADYCFLDWEHREVHLSELFGDRDELILVHNMGSDCSYCTMWADGFIGLAPHLSDRAAFVVTSPDPPDAQKEFANSRGWTFPMFSADRHFIDDMGFLDSNQGMMPGVSAFVRAADVISRVARAEFGPGDAFCPVWHFLELLPNGANGWEPRYSYEIRRESSCCSKQVKVGN